MNSRFYPRNIKLFVNKKIYHLCVKLYNKLINGVELTNHGISFLYNIRMILSYFILKGITTINTYKITKLPLMIV